tara:strand:- start:478 stop:1581 length:1104 start_codon:yes stop_codon:yes gene_type:complete
LISNTKINNLFQIKNLVIFSVILGGIKLIEQLIKGKYFHDFNVYLNAIKVLDNSGNPYFNIIELPYLYPPIISKLLEISNQSVFGILYLIIYISIIFFAFIISEKNIKTSLFISFGISGIFVKSLLTGNISNIFYFLIIISIFFYYKKQNFLPYYISVFFMSIVKFNFIILFLLPIIIHQNRRKELIKLSIFIIFLTSVYAYQYLFINKEFIDFISALKSYNQIDGGSSIFAFLNYKLEFNLPLSISIHLIIFTLLLFILIKKRNEIDPKIFLLSILILLIFSNPRLKLYDVAFGIVFLNLAILHFDKKTIVNFFVFNLFAILLIKEITKFFDLSIGNPKMLAWYIFLFFFLILYKKFRIDNDNKIN